MANAALFDNLVQRAKQLKVDQPQSESLVSQSLEAIQMDKSETVHQAIAEMEDVKAQV